MLLALRRYRYSEIISRMTNVQRLAHLIGAVLVLTRCLPADSGGVEAQLDRSTDCVSPGGTAVATFYIIFGGGAAGFQEEYVNVRAHGDTLRLTSPMANFGHVYDVRFEWPDDRHLTVRYPTGGRANDFVRQVVLATGDTIALTFAVMPGVEGEFVDSVGTLGCKPEFSRRPTGSLPLRLEGNDWVIFGQPRIERH
jgi:hypothetical protein